jgi:hypothetical protein
MRKSQEEGLIKVNIKIVLLILILAIIVFALSIFPGAQPAQKNDNKTSLNYSNTSITPGQVPASNTTNKTRTGAISIPLEKPPFID